MIFFGWGHQTSRDYGLAFEKTCPNCNNNDYWHFVRLTTWFTLFFIPVIPYSNKYMLLCPVCDRGYQVQGEKINKLKLLSKANNDLFSNKITPEAYHQIMANITEIANPPENPQLEDTQSNENKKINDEILYCRHCGEKIQSDASFCHKCGKQIN